MFDRALGEVKRRAPALPVILIGHSMGGLIVTLWALHRDDVAGLVVSSPAYANKVVVPPWKDALGKAMSKVWPALAIPTGLDAALVSRDIDVVNAYDADPLVTNKATARWYTETLDAQATVMTQAKQMTVPLLALAAGGDQIVDATAIDTFVQACGSADKTIQHYPELYHEVFNEPEREAVFADVVGWIQARTAPTA